MYQFYIIEIQQYANGEFGHIVHYAYDADADTARLKAESKYHEVLAAAAISNLPSHAATLISQEGYPVMHQCYRHNVVPETVTVEPETVAEEPEEPEADDMDNVSAPTDPLAYEAPETEPEEEAGEEPGEEETGE